MINMGTHIAEERSAIYFLVGILSLTLASCITTMPETQTFIGNTASITEENTCDTTLEKGPANKSNFEGVRMTVNCDVNDNNSHNILWRRSSGLGKWQTIGNNTNILYKPSSSYKIKFESDEQMYKFVIKNATFQRDSGIYECGYECTPGGNFISLASAEVTVIHRPTCVIQTLPFSRSNRGNEFEVVCSWAPGQEGDARFESSGGPIGSTTLSFKDRIISRFESNDTTDVVCRFSSSSNPSLTTTEPCPMRDGKVRVDPFIDEVAAGSNASFVCSSDYSRYSWNIRLDKELNSEGNGRIDEHEYNLTLVDVNESDQDILVECSVQDHVTGNISSFGIIRIVEVTTPTLETPGDYTTQLTYRETSESVHDTSPRSGQPTSKSTEAALTTYPSVSAQLPTGSLACKRYRLPSLDGSALNREFEVICSWTSSQVNYPYFQGINGEMIDAVIKFSNQIITRVNSSGADISCTLLVNTNTSRINTTTPCMEGIHRLIRVDPFMSEVAVGSTAVINCTFNKNGRHELSWKVKSDGNTSAVNVFKHERYPNVTFSVHEQVRENYLIFECRFLRSDKFGSVDLSSYGALHVVEGTTVEFQTPLTMPGDTSTVIKEMRTSEMSKFTTFNNKASETHSGHTNLPIDQSSTQKEEDQMVNQTNGGEPHSPPPQNVTVKILISVLAVLAVIIVIFVILYLRKKLLPSRRHDEKPDGIELSNIPHILHEESSQWYALSFKDKRVQQSPSDDLKTLHHHDHSGDTLNSALSTSIGMLTLQPSDFSSDHLYAEPGAAGNSEEPLRDIISRQQCTFTPLTDND